MFTMNKDVKIDNPAVMELGGWIKVNKLAGS